MLQPGLVDEEVLVGGLGVVELAVEQVDRLLDLADLVDEAVVDGVPAELDVGAVGAGLEAGLGHLEMQLKTIDNLSRSDG